MVVPDLVWAGFLRIVTNRGIFEVSATPVEALEFVTAITGADSYLRSPPPIGTVENRPRGHS